MKSMPGNRKNLFKRFADNRSALVPVHIVFHFQWRGHKKKEKSYVVFSKHTLC